MALVGAASAARSSWSSIRNWPRSSRPGCRSSQSLDILRQRVENPTFKAVLDGVYEKVQSGTALSDAFAEHGDLFPPVYSASLLAGERSGNLDSVIRRYVAYEKLIGAARRRTISALIYPAILVAMMVILIGIIVLRVIPAFSDFYANFDRPLPLLTRVIVGISDALVSNFWIIAPAVIGVGFWRVFWLRRPSKPRPSWTGCCCTCHGRGDRPEVLYVSAGADAVDAARRRHPAG